MKGKEKQRDAFILYKSHYEPISVLTDEQLGRLFRAIFQWQINGKADPEPGPDIAMAFGFILNQFRIDNEKYKNRCDQNRDNVLSRWEAEKKVQSYTTVYNRIQPNTKHTDNDNEKEKEKVITNADEIYND